MGQLTQEIIDSWRVFTLRLPTALTYVQQLKPFIPVPLYKTPLENCCVRFLHRNVTHDKPLVGCSLILPKEDHFLWHKAP